MIKFDVFNWLTGKISFTAKIDCSEGAERAIKLGLAVKWAVENRADLSYGRLDGASLDGGRLDGARLDGASLVRASLVGASLDGASLDGASLVRASLDGASLDGARLVGASLDGASLDGASLVRASLVGASLDGARLDGARLDGARLDGARLDGASLVRASLVGASLDGASLDGARLDGASLRPIRTDFFDILIRAQPEVPALLNALRGGKINGSTYTGDCACLCGTIAKARNVSHKDLGFIDSERPAERWFLGINVGDTPENNPIAKITEGWILEFMEIVGIPALEIEAE